MLALSLLASAFVMPTMLPHSQHASRHHSVVMLQTKTTTDITHALHATDVHHTKELYTTEEVRRAMASTADRTPTIILFGAKACKN